MKKSWGGGREGAGRKPGWKSGPCKAVKLPVLLVDDVLRYAHGLDEGHSPAPPGPVITPRSDKGWAQLSKLIDEKQELEKRLKHLQDQLARERKRVGLLEAVGKRHEAAIADARSILHHAYREQRSDGRKRITVADVRSSLLALGLDVDRPGDGSTSKPGLIE